VATTEGMDTDTTDTITIDQCAVPTRSADSLERNYQGRLIRDTNADTVGIRGHWVGVVTVVGEVESCKHD
jgi:hypothetical protein